jgi:hypothetical protein
VKKPLIMPIMRTKEENAMGCPNFVPFVNVDKPEFQKQADANHGQTLEHLADRGGLSPQELYAILHGVRYREVSKIDVKTAVVYLIQMVEK